MEFTFIPDYGASKEKTPIVNVTKFGCYEQRQGVGINNQLEIWSLNFAFRELSVADAIDSFLTEQAGVSSFDWTPPLASISRKFVCRSWTYVPNQGGSVSISARFEEVGEP